VENILLQPLDGSPGHQVTDFTSENISQFQWSQDGKCAVRLFAVYQKGHHVPHYQREFSRLRPCAKGGRVARLFLLILSPYSTSSAVFGFRRPSTL
jgi:hypothetical protein